MSDDNRETFRVRVTVEVRLVALSCDSARRNVAAVISDALMKQPCSYAMTDWSVSP